MVELHEIEKIYDKKETIISVQRLRVEAGWIYIFQSTDFMTTTFAPDVKPSVEK